MDITTGLIPHLLYKHLFILARSIQATDSHHQQQSARDLLFQIELDQQRQLLLSDRIVASSWLTDSLQHTGYLDKKFDIILSTNRHHNGKIVQGPIMILKKVRIREVIRGDPW